MQVFGEAAAIKLLGYLLDRPGGWDYYFYYLIPFGVLGGVLIYSIAHHHSLKNPAGAMQ